ncbi:hypothetical protein [Bradyrhizobium sp. USDA 328]|uniref:hypothetical protein n=1 Tax=Bradyrhizobium sp. USDA 328 TaxID=3156309 RepID=UPI003515F84E
MDRQNFDPSNVPAGSLARHAVSEEPQAGPAGQDVFEQHLAEASQAAPVASGHRATSYPHLSTEDRNFIDTVIPHEHDAAQSSAAKRRRTLPDLEEVVIYRQSNANAASGESSGAPQVATTGIIVRGRSDERPLYSKDAAVLKLEHALIERGMKSRGAHEHVSRLITYSRWLFENKLPSIVDRLDSKSLIDDGAIHKYTGGRNADLLKSLNYFRTFWAAEELVVRAKRDNSSQSALLNPESAVQMEPRRIDGTAGSRGPGHPHLSTEDRNQYAAQKNPKPGTVRAAEELVVRAKRDNSSQSALLNPESAVQMEPRRIDGTAGSRGPGHPHLSTEDRNLIDSAIAQYAAQKNPKPGTVRAYTKSLYRLGNDLRARGQTTDLANHDALAEHVNTYFSDNENIKAALSVLRPHNTYPHLSTEDRNHIDSAIAQYAAQNNSQPETVKSYTQALYRLGNDFRARGQTTDLANHDALVEHANTHFRTNGKIRTGLSVLRAYHDPAPDYLSTEDRNHIDSAIAQYVAQNNSQPKTVRRYTQALHRLVNDLRARGQTTDLADYKSLLDHATTYFPNNPMIKVGLSVLRAYHDPNHLVSRGRPRALPSGKDASNDVQQTLRQRTDARAGSNLLPSEGVLINHEHDTAQSRAAKRRRTLIDPSPQNVALINPESAAPMGPLRIDAAAAQHSAPHEASTRLGELQEEQDGQHAPSAFTQEQTAFHPEQLPQGELQRLETQLQDEHHGVGDNHPAQSFPVDSEEFTFDLDQFHPGELRRLLDDDPAEELQEWRDDHSAPSAFIQAQAAFHSEQLPQGELQRVQDHLDDQAMPSAVSVASEELQRLEKQLHDELQGRRDNHPALSFSIDPEDLTLDRELFSPEELLRPLDDEPAEELQERRDDHSAPSAFIQAQAAFHSEQLPQGELERLEKQLHDELQGRRDNHPALSFSIDPEDLTLDRELFSPEELLRPLDDEPAEELQERRDDHPAPSAFIQAQAAFHSEQLPQGELERLEKQLHDELQGRRDNHPALSFSIDPEDLTLDRELFSPEELLRPLDDEPAEEVQKWRGDHPPV